MGATSSKQSTGLTVGGELAAAHSSPNFAPSLNLKLTCSHSRLQSSSDASSYVSNMPSLRDCKLTNISSHQSSSPSSSPFGSFRSACHPSWTVSSLHLPRISSQYLQSTINPPHRLSTTQQLSPLRATRRVRNSSAESDEEARGSKHGRTDPSCFIPVRLGGEMKARWRRWK